MLNLAGVLLSYKCTIYCKLLINGTLSIRPWVITSRIVIRTLDVNLWVFIWYWVGQADFIVKSKFNFVKCMK